MKKIIVFAVLIMGLNATNGQPKFPTLDSSPMDMSYCPNDYPILKIQDKATEPLVARIIYGRPQKNGRTIFGDLVPYGMVWRLGANEATEIEFFKDIKMGGKKVIKGRYTLYALIDTGKWSIILNKETDIWGAFKYDPKKDFLRVDVPVQKQNDPAEVFTILFEKDTTGTANLLMTWDDVLVKIPLSW